MVVRAEGAKKKVVIVGAGWAGFGAAKHLASQGEYLLIRLAGDRLATRTRYTERLVIFTKNESKDLSRTSLNFLSIHFLTPCLKKIPLLVLLLDRNVHC